MLLLGKSLVGLVQAEKSSTLEFHVLHLSSNFTCFVQYGNMSAHSLFCGVRIRQQYL